MIYANFDFYNREYRGQLSSDQFELWSLRASLQIDKVTFGRAGTAPAAMKQALRLCCCALTEQMVAWESIDQATMHGAVTSENVDGYSVSWRDGGTSAELHNNRKIVLRGICTDYLTSPINLMYTGACYR